VSAVRQDGSVLADSLAGILTQPLPHQPHSRLKRIVCRAVVALARRHVIAVHGLEHVHPRHDPFILALNHSQRLEALVVPALLIFQRGGRAIHFLADWNFHLLPPVALLYHAGEVITLTRKPARPAFLNVLKPLFTHRVPG
jgi:1-acyl-sn-glycerol-3-phosphate acyltransferase